MVRTLQLALIFLVMASCDGNERHRVGCAGGVQKGQTWISFNTQNNGN